MTVVRTHTYTVDPADLDDFLGHRRALIAAVRASHAGLSEVHLARLEDGAYSDAWHWDSAEQRDAALAAIGDFADAPRAMALTRDGLVHDGEIIDRR